MAEEINLAPALVALRGHVFGILEGEIERARARARGDDSAATEKALRHLVGVLLHTPMQRSREYAHAGEARAWVDGLEALFGILPEEAAASPAMTEDERPAV